jgi:hypothetical protein
MADWTDSEVRNPSFCSAWPGRWEIFGPTDLDQLTDDAASEVDAIDVADGGGHVVATVGMRGLAGAGDPTVDLVDGRTVYIDDVSGGLSDSFPGAGVREPVHVCGGGTVLPAVDGDGRMQAQECDEPDVDRDARLLSELGATTALSGSPSDGVVSADGSRVFFLAPDPDAAGVPDGIASFCASEGDTCPAQLFVRQRAADGSVVTRWISKAEDGLFGSQDAELTGAVRFEGATADGNRVFFRTNSPLTVDDPNGEGAQTPGGVTEGTAAEDSWDLYMYELPADQDADPADGALTRISAGPEGDGDCNRPQGAGGTSAMLRSFSDDGSRVYFVCAAPLDGVPAPDDPEGERLTAPDGDPAVTDAANLYLYDATRTESDRWRFVARLPADLGGGLDGCATSGAEWRSPLTGSGQSSAIELAGQDVNCLRPTADGAFVTFWTVGRLTADDPDDSSADVYGYDADSDRLTRITAAQGGVGGTYECVTGGPTAGLRCHGDPGLEPGAAGTRTLGVATHPEAEGDRVAFFHSRSRLVPEDGDDAYDVYMWRNGELSLLTTGASDTDGAFYKGNDASGRNVYFATRDRLSWQDSDEVLDIYTARRGGGIAQPAPPAVCGVLGDACQGPGERLGDGSQIGSTVPRGGNVSPPARAGLRLALGRPGARARRRAVRSGVVRLPLRASGQGVVRAVARARLRSRTGRPVVRRVGTGRVRIRRAGRHAVAVQLNRRARRQLRRRGRLAVAVRVVARGAEPEAVRFVLRRSGRSARRQGRQGRASDGPGRAGR